MTVNLSLSLKKRIACSTIFNASCHIARRKYNIPNVNLTDVCDFEGNKIKHIFSRDQLIN